MAATAQFHVDQARVASQLQSGHDSDTTRLLCAAAHLDEAFCNRVINEVVDEPYQAVGPSHGVHLPTVIEHCLAAKQRRNRRDLIIVFVLLVAFVASLILELPLFLAAFFIVWSIVVWEMWYSHYRIVARYLSKHQFLPETVRPRRSKRVARVLAYAAEAQNGNTVVYSGFTPFVGSGTIVGGWSFSLNVEIGTKQGDLSTPLKPEPFRVSELYEDVARELFQLRIPEVSVTDRLYVHGQGIRSDRRFLKHPLARPYPNVPESIISTYRDRPAHTIRFYQCIEAISWNGDLITSVLLRFTLNGCYLFTEVNYLVLPPLKEKYRIVDSLQQSPSWRKRWSFVPKSLLVALKWNIFWWMIVLIRGAESFQHARERSRMRKRIAEDEAFNYGAEESVRQRESAGEYLQYFQRLDTEMYLKIFQKQILDAITEFLDEHNIDTSELRSRQEAILNNGVIITGDSPQIGNVIAGKDVRVKQGVAQAARTIVGRNPSQPATRA